MCWIYGHDNINIVIQCKLPRFCGENPLTFSRHGGYKTWALRLEIAGLDLFINKWVMQHPYKSFIKFGTELWVIWLNKEYTLTPNSHLITTSQYDLGTCMFEWSALNPMYMYMEFIKYIAPYFWSNVWTLIDQKYL